ncbi:MULTISPECIES: Dam family site-specific DNA-(adenine-N6)-methyltransferase [unclassified Bacteroides]|uniref:DNA adenine methylase n=1 Tax=unclassified Bacteroides TaxID=2646097 RepID=UPI0004E19F09|nr:MULTISPECIES: Dam family site-specific DNA-(adenine-N6)-methyltransferase [unclassified Bacteroides]
MKNGIVRSPLFYVGDKYKLMEEIGKYIPKQISRFVEPFVGGGSVFMNVEADEFLLNDIDANIIAIHKMLCGYASDRQEFYKQVDTIVEQYCLSCSYKKDIVPSELKKEFVKTYYARFNKLGYERMRSDYNKSSERSVFMLYMLLIYGFNRMIRFNRSGDFNLPVGNVDLNQNTIKALNDYFKLTTIKKPQWFNLDFEKFIDSIELSANDLVYLDPPYLITFSEYNKYWNEETEKRLLSMLNGLNDKGIRFAISNVTRYKGRENQLFLDWSQNYHSHSIKSNYISYHDNTNKTFTEVLVTNY